MRISDWCSDVCSSDLVLCMARSWPNLSSRGLRTGAVLSLTVMVLEPSLVAHARAHDASYASELVGPRAMALGGEGRRGAASHDPQSPCGRGAPVRYCTVPK